MQTITDHVDLEQAIAYGEKLGATYVDLRHLAIQRTAINLKDGKGETIFGEDKGTAIRVLADGSWGQVSTVDEDIKDIKQAVRNAYTLATNAGRFAKQKIKLADADPIQDEYKVDFTVDPRDINPQTKYEMVESIHQRLMNYSDVIKTTTINYVDITGQQLYQNSDGTVLTLDKCSTWAKIVATGIKEGVRVGGREEMGSPLGYEVFQGETLENIIHRLGERVVKMVNAKKGKGGNFPAVLGGPVAGVFAHEACGHLFEADLTQNGVVGQVLGKQIGSKHATIVDDGTIEDELGFVPYDDEGVPGQKTTIVDEGRVAALLTDRQYAKTFEGIVEQQGVDMDVSPSGSARAFDFRVHPVIRMRNTYFETGDMTWEELLEGIDFGYYLVDFRGGQANLNGTFTVGVQEAYEIVNGEIGDPVRGVSISGNTLETLNEISGVGKEENYRPGPGRCGKFQTAFITSGSSNMRVDKVTISGES